MKKLMMALGLAAIAALALAAFGAASASATVCSNAGTGTACAGASGGKELTVGDKIIAKSETPNVVRLTSGFINVTCGWSEVEISITAVTPSVTGKVTKLTFTDCHSNLNTTSGSCTASTTASAANGWPGTATTTTEPNGKMEIENVKGEFSCTTIGTTTCVYEAAKVGNGHSTGEEIKINGGSPATVEAKHVELTKGAGSGSACSATAIWEGTYTVTSPTSLFME
jgi:hypothetical protein